MLWEMTTGARKWGVPLYVVSSTILGSIMMNWTSSGVRVQSSEAMIEFTHTLLPEPVAPAMSRWGIVARSVAMGLPATSVTPVVTVAS